jgi:hypothetical protein
MLEIAEDEARARFYDRLSDHYTGDLDGSEYFPRFFAETDTRYKARPKKVLTLGASALEVLTGAMLGDGVQVTIGDDNSDAAWQEIVEVNGIGDQFAQILAENAGLYGWAVCRVAPAEFPISRAADFELEAVDPRYFRAAYNRAAIGKAVRRVDGIAFHTLYNPQNGSILPLSETPSGGVKYRQRVEVMTDEVWQVFLDGEPTPRDPVTGELWAPDKDGKNPFGVVMAAPFWNVIQAGAFEGRSDLDPSYRVAEEINVCYSQLIYNIMHYFPTLVAPQDEQGGNSPEARGIGLMLRYVQDGTPPAYIAPPFDVGVLLSPLKLQLNLFFSFAHTPASAHGLGTVVGEASTAESGKAKSYEFERMTKHVKKKRANFERGIRRLYRTIAQGASNAGIQGMDPAAPVAVEWESEIVPVSAEEKRDGILLEMEKGVRSVLEAVMALRGIEDTEDGREQAQVIVDEIAEQAGRAQPMSRLEAEIRREGQLG